MRPGFLGKWIEILVHHSKPALGDLEKNIEAAPKSSRAEDIVEAMKERWELQKEMKKLSLFNQKKKDSNKKAIPIKDIA